MMKKIAFFLAAGLLLIACNNDDDSYTEFFQATGTMEKTGDGAYDYEVRLDNGNTLIPFKDSESGSDFFDGQRVLSLYSPISSSDDQNGGKIINAAIHDVDPILTKNVFVLTEANKDSIGNDPIHLHEENIWMSDEYLNFHFSYLGYNASHYINLIKYENDSTDANGKLLLEFRHNSNNDYPEYEYTGFASFNLNSLYQEGMDSISFVVKIDDYYDGVYYWEDTYYFDDTVAVPKSAQYPELLLDYK